METGVFEVNALKSETSHWRPLRNSYKASHRLRSFRDSLHMDTIVEEKLEGLNASRWDGLMTDLKYLEKMVCFFCFSFYNFPIKGDIKIIKVIFLSEIKKLFNRSESHPLKWYLIYGCIHRWAAFPRLGNERFPWTFTLWSALTPYMYSDSRKLLHSLSTKIPSQ